MERSHSINDIVLAVTNDGDGSMCGMNYKRRCEASENGIFDFRVACRRYSDYRAKHFEQRSATRDEIIAAATELQAYYRRHMAEAQC